MLKIGIVGAENSHCGAIANLCNVEKKVRARVPVIWGETRKVAEAAAEKGRVPEIVKDWRDMLGKVDGVMIDHRHPAPHAEAATFFVKNGVPCFIDKPFVFTVAEGKRLCRLARKKRVPIVSFSTIPLQKDFAEFKAKLDKMGGAQSITTTGPADLTSKYGGVFFYGIHQTDALVALLGTEVDRVSCVRKGKGGAAIVTWRHGLTVTMNFVADGNYSFHWSAVGPKEFIWHTHVNDPDPYLAGARIFVKMFKTGKEPFTHERFLAPVAMLEAMAKSMQERRTVKVAAVEM